MNRLLASVLVGTALFGTTLLVGAPACSAQSAQSADIAAIKQLNEDWIHNYVVKDSSVWNRIFSDDFILVNPGGKKMSKRDILSTPFQPIGSAWVDTAEVQIHGAIGLIHARCSFTMPADGKEIKGQTDYLDVYEKRNGRWWAIAAHVTYLGGN